jgi:hypothetical protein
MTQPDANPPPRRQPPPNRRDSGLYLPAWSVAAMLVVVLTLAGGIILLVYSLGGRAAPAGAPRVEIITAVPSTTPLPPEPGEIVVLLPTPTAFAPGAAIEVPAFQLEGPALPTANISPTPDTIAVGKIVEVINVGESELNVRSDAGTSNGIVFTSPEGTAFEVINGPKSADGLIWWNVRLVANPSQVGWAAENNGEQDLLRVAPPE